MNLLSLLITPQRVAQQRTLLKRILVCIEACGSVVKSVIKRQLSARQAELFDAPPRMTQVAHRLQVIREIADEAVLAEVNPMLVMRCITHCHKYWPTVMELRDLPLGN